MAHKVAVVRTLMTRASALSSSGVERVDKEKKIVEALQQNGYPLGFVHKYSCPRRRMESDDQGPRTTVTLPYISGVSQAVRRILAPLNIQVMFRPLSTLKHMLVHPKDVVPPDEQKGVVYCVPCEGCPRRYIGQTGRSLKHRLAEHRRALSNPYAYLVQ